MTNKMSKEYLTTIITRGNNKKLTLIFYINLNAEGASCIHAQTIGMKSMTTSIYIKKNILNYLNSLGRKGYQQWILLTSRRFC